MNAKIYNSLRNGGRHATLLGDMRKNGVYYSIQKDMVWYGDLESHVIKAQHNHMSGNRDYKGNFIPIIHEHLLIFKKNMIWSIPVTVTRKVVKNLCESALATWRDLVQAALEHLGGTSNLDALYQLLEGTDKAKKNQHWKAKIRQTLQIGKEFAPVDRGIWSLQPLGQNDSSLKGVI